MSKTFTLRGIAAAAGLAAALIGAAPAQAQSVYALSHLDISNLSLGFSNGSGTVNSFTFNLTNTATLNGASTIQTATCNSSGNPCSAVSPVLDAPPANAPGSAPIRANNNFSFLGFGGATSYSNSDSVITSAAVVQGLPTSTQQIAESLLVGSGTAAASTLVQSNTTLSLQITVSSGANLALSFSADPDLEARIASVANGAYSSQADVSSTFTLRNNSTGGFVTWSPTGTSANDCFSNIAGLICTETADTQNLNTGVGTGTNGTDVTSSFDAAQTLTAFGINIAGLAAGTYSLTLAAGTSTSIFQTIPEPGTTALVGLALAGLAVTGKRGRSLFSRKA